MRVGLQSLAPIVLALLLVPSCEAEDPSDEDGEIWFPSAPPVRPPIESKYEPGSTSVATRLVLGPSGGSLTAGADTPLSGLVLDFPPDALHTDTEVTLSIEDGTFLETVGEPRYAFVLEATGVDNFPDPVRLSLPPRWSGYLPIAFLVGEDGDFLSLEPLDFYVDSRTVSFLIEMPGRYVVLDYPSTVEMTSPDEASSEPPEDRSSALRQSALVNISAVDIDTGFRPEYDGFKMRNRIGRYTPFAQCLGMAQWAAWYYWNRVDSFYGMYDQKVQCDDDLKRHGEMTVEQIIASRAHIAYSNGLSKTRTFDKKAINASKVGYPELYDHWFNDFLVNTLAERRHPLVVGMFATAEAVMSTIGHAVVVFAAHGDSWKEVRYAVYDPNYPHPNPPRNLIFRRNRGFLPYANLTSTGNQASYRHFKLLSEGRMEPTEEMEQILAQAERNQFFLRCDPTLEVGNYEIGGYTANDTIPVGGPPTFAVRVTSGDIRVTRVRAESNGRVHGRAQVSAADFALFGTQSEECNLAGGGECSLIERCGWNRVQFFLDGEYLRVNDEGVIKEFRSAGRWPFIRDLNGKEISGTGSWVTSPIDFYGVDSMDIMRPDPSCNLFSAKLVATTGDPQADIFAAQAILFARVVPDLFLETACALTVKEPAPCDFGTDALSLALVAPIDEDPWAWDRPVEIVIAPVLGPVPIFYEGTITWYPSTSREVVEQVSGRAPGQQGLEPIYHVVTRHTFTREAKQ